MYIYRKTLVKYQNGKGWGYKIFGNIGKYVQFLILKRMVAQSEKTSEKVHSSGVAKLVLEWYGN